MNLSPSLFSRPAVTGRFPFNPRETSPPACFGPRMKSNLRSNISPPQHVHRPQLFFVTPVQSRRQRTRIKIRGGQRCGLALQLVHWPSASRPCLWASRKLPSAWRARVGPSLLLAIAHWSFVETKVSVVSHQKIVRWVRSSAPQRKRSQPVNSLILNLRFFTS